MKRTVTVAMQRETLIRVRSSLERLGLGSVAAKERLDSFLENIQGAHQDLEAAIYACGLSQEDTAFIGELSMAGDLRETRELAWFQTDKPILVVPLAQARLAKTFHPEKLVCGAETLEQVIVFCKRIRPALKADFKPTQMVLEELPKPLRAAYQVAAETLAANRTPLLVGHSAHSIARRLVNGLPPMKEAEAIEVTRQHLAAGLVWSKLLTGRPYRAPHHTISRLGLVGNGKRPGELQLAISGVLFLDEIVEFPRAVLREVRLPQGHLVLGQKLPRDEAAREIVEKRLSLIETQFNAVRIDLPVAG